MNLMDLGVEQAGQSAPDAFGLTSVLEPLTEVSSESVEVEFETVTTENWKRRRGERLMHLMDEVLLFTCQLKIGRPAC